MAVADYDPIINEAAANWHLDPNWVRAVMHQESGGNPTKNGKPIRSSAGAGGLAQFMPGTAAAVGVEDVDDPKQAIWGMTKHLSQLYDQFNGNVLAATAAYNANPNTVQAWVNGKGQLPAETQKYVPAVASHYAMFSKARATQPAANDVPSDDDFLKAINPQQSVPPGIPIMRITPGASVPSDEEFLQQIAPNNPAPKPDTGPQNQSQDGIVRGDALDAMMPEIPRDVAANTPTGNALGGDQWAPAAVAPNALSTSYQTVTNALAPAPGTTYGNVLPFARDNQTGAIRMALPSSLRSLAQGGADLAFGPGLGTVTPQATMALANIVPGMMQSPAANPGRFTLLPRETPAAPNALSPSQPPSQSLIFPGTAAESPAPSFVPPSAAGPANDLARIQQLIRADQQVAANKPQFVPPTSVIDPLTGQASAIRQPPNPLAPSAVPEVPINPLSVARLPAPETIAPKSVISPIAAQEAATPTGGSVGAAASREMAPPGSIPRETPAQTATSLQKMVNQSAEDRLTPQGRDDAVYVPGVERPEAMRDFTPASEGQLSSAMQHKTLYNTDTAYHDAFDAQVKKNNDVMVDRLHGMFGDANSREAAMQDARELMPGSINLFEGQKPVDIQPISDKIQEILSGPASKIDGVRNIMQRMEPKLLDAEGNPETMPSQIKGIFDDINNKLYDKSPTTEGNEARQASNQLKELKAVVSNVIGGGLPEAKWTNYLSNLSNALGNVSKLDYMQRYLTGPKKLTNLKGDLQLNKVQKMLEDIQAHYADKTGGAKEISMDEINTIEAVRNELAAKALLDSRAAVRGSPTPQITNAAAILGSGPLGAAVKGGAEAALHGVLAGTTGGVGNALLGGYRFILKPAVQAANQRKAANALAATKARLLDTTPNPLQSP